MNSELDLFGAPIAPRRMGRRPLVPTDDQRGLVRRRLDAGEPVTTVASGIGLSIATFYRHFAAELAERSQVRLGRPRHAPTPDLRRQVRVMRADGASLERIADRVGITVPTLCRHYSDVLGRPPTGKCNDHR